MYPLENVQKPRWYLVGLCNYTIFGLLSFFHVITLSRFNVIIIWFILSLLYNSIKLIFSSPYPHVKTWWSVQMFRVYNIVIVFTALNKFVFLIKFVELCIHSFSIVCFSLLCISMWIWTIIFLLKKDKLFLFYLT